MVAEACMVSGGSGMGGKGRVRERIGNDHAEKKDYESYRVGWRGSPSVQDR